MNVSIDRVKSSINVESLFSIFVLKSSYSTEHIDVYIDLPSSFTSFFLSLISLDSTLVQDGLNESSSFLDSTLSLLESLLFQYLKL